MSSGQAPDRGPRLPPPPGGGSHRAWQPRLAAALDDYQAAVVRGNPLDAVTTELVRIRCARVHDCRACRTLRLVDARDEGADEALLSQVDAYESSALAERHKVVLRLTDAHLFAVVSDGLADQVRAHLTPQEASAVVLLVTKFSVQKSLVVLGLDAPTGTLFTFDSRTGASVRLGATAPASARPGAGASRAGPG